MHQIVTMLSSAYKFFFISYLYYSIKQSTFIEWYQIEEISDMGQRLKPNSKVSADRETNSKTGRRMRKH